MRARGAVVLLLVALGTNAGCETSLGARADTGARGDGGLDATLEEAHDAALERADAWPDTDASVADDALAAPDAVVSPDAFVEPDAGPSCPPPGPMDCSPGPGTGEGAECYLGTSCFLREVQNAIRAVVDGNPSWFDASAGPTHVLEVELYMDAVVAALNAAGLCAIRDPNAGDEIAVKWNNLASENFDILTASEDVRSGGGIYTSTCAPAWW
jgi:hypothetical protein